MGSLAGTLPHEPPGCWVGESDAIELSRKEKAQVRD
jgi:hypothetical protein